MKLALTSALICSLATFGCEKSETEKTDDNTKGETSEKDSPEPEAGKKVEPDKDKTADTSTPAPGAAGDAVKITLLEPGAEPRSALRFKLDPQKSFKMEMRMGMGMKISAGPVQQPKIKLPDMISVMEIKPLEVSKTRGKYEWVISSYQVANTPGVMPAVRAELQKSLKSMVGATGTNTFDNRGRNLGATFKLPPGVPPQLAQMMEGMRNAMSTMSAPFPAEAVGVGGKWQNEMVMDQNGSKANVKYTFTVKSLSGDKVKLDVAMTMAGVPGKITPPGMPPGATGVLDSMTGKGKGTLELDLASIIPAKSTLKSTNKSAVTISMGGQKQSVKTDVDIDLLIKQL